jgi:glycosyltransferase involved in cell wall biosynthesis
MRKAAGKAFAGRRALIVSPTPSHPADHGHRNRVRQTTNLLRDAGHEIDFVLYPMDDDWQCAIPPGLARMQAAWGGLVTVVPPSRKLHGPPAGTHHTLDEWWDPALEAQIAFLCRRRAYDVMLVNYIFLSRAFLHVPRGCRRVLDTHDRLSGRRELFERHGAQAEFFFTTPAEEAAAFARADIVLAIKQSEAARFREITTRPVITLPFAPRRGAARLHSPGPAREAVAAPAPLRIGFIGADNSVNAINLAAFLARLARWHALYLPHLAVIVAGNVCRRVAPAPGCVPLGFVTLLGHLEDASTFYRAVDVVVAPLAFSTGLKIKVAEALSHGVPLIATADAFDGFAAADPAPDPWHTLPDIDSVCAAVIALAADHLAGGGRLAALACATRAAAAASRRAVGQGAAALRAALAAPRPWLAVITDLDPGARATLAEESCCQAIEFFSDMLDVRVPPQDGPDAVATWIAPQGEAPRLVCCGDPPTRKPPPPLRHLPPVLRWGEPDAGVPLALAVVEEGADREEQAARVALTGAVLRVCRAHRVAVLRSAHLAHDRAVLAALANLPAPRAIIGIDLAEGSRDLLRRLAGLAGAAFFPLGGPYPLLAEGAAPCLVRHAGEHIDAIAAWLREGGPHCGSEATGDAGWTRLRAKLERAGALDLRPPDLFELDRKPLGACPAAL